MAMMNILVTGGAGFVGSYLCRLLLNEGHSVTAVDDLSNGKRANIVDGINFIEADITSADLPRKLVDLNFDVVIHCAAQSSNAISFRDPKQDMMTNQLGTLNVLDLCLDKKVKHCVFTSSMSVYGQPKSLPTKESENCLPDSFYAAHKLASEHYLRMYAEQHGLKYTIFRLYTTYGHGQSLENKDQGLLSIYLSYIVNKEKLIVKGSKDRTRDIVHVDDVAKAIILSLKNPAAFGKIYNLGTGKSIKIREIVELLTTGMGYRKDEYTVSYEGTTPGDPFDTLANIQAAKRDLGWEPKIFAEEGIRLTLAGLKNQ